MDCEIDTCSLVNELCSDAICSDNDTEENASEEFSMMFTKQLASFYPSSLSTNDLCFDYHNPSKNCTNLNKMSQKDQINFIKPASEVSNAKHNTFKSTSKFSYMIRSITKTTTVPLMEYSLPNIRKLKCPVKARRPLMIVSFSECDPKKASSD